jgi:hypothetical protein
MTMEDVAELGYFIIKYIETNELDLAVGIGDKRPQIWFLPNAFNANGKPRYEQPSQALLDKFETNNRLRLQRYQQSLIDDYKV